MVSERLKTDRETLEASPEKVVFFKSVILVQKIVEAAQEALSE